MLSTFAIKSSILENYFLELQELERESYIRGVPVTADRIYISRHVLFLYLHTGQLDQYVVLCYILIAPPCLRCGG